MCDLLVIAKNLLLVSRDVGVQPNQLEPPEKVQSTKFSPPPGGCTPSNPTLFIRGCSALSSKGVNKGVRGELLIPSGVGLGFVRFTFAVTTSRAPLEVIILMIKFTYNALLCKRTKARRLRLRCNIYFNFVRYLAAL